MNFIQILACLMIVALFVFSKAQAHEKNMFPKYQKIFEYIKNVVKPVLSILSSFFKPFKIGNGLFIDSTQFVLLILLLLILIL